MKAMRGIRKKIVSAFTETCGRDGKCPDLRAAGIFLLLLSYIYMAAAVLHRRLGRAKRLECPVISVGNILCGGTGKTPAVEYIAERLLGEGRRIAVLSRGYMRSGTSPFTVVSDGEKLLPGAAGGGDEPVMLAENLPGVPVISGKNRYRTGALALSEYGVSGVILDDGFQHYSLARDMDIVVIDSTRPFGNGYLLPRGALREKPGSLRRADLLILTHVNFCDDIGRVREMLFRAAGEKPVVETVHMAAGFRGINSGAELPPGGLDGKKAVALSGIGSPWLFEKTLSARGITVLASCRFPDHHPYTRKDVEAVSEKARRLGADCVITTLKDAVRLKAAGPGPDEDIFAMKVRLCPLKGGAELDRLLSACFSGASRS